jgi:hypothetical protein
MSVKEMRKLNVLNRIMVALAQAGYEAEEIEGFIHYEIACALYYVAGQKRAIEYMEKLIRRRKEHIHKTFDDFDDDFCWINFRTRKQDLPRLLRAFKLDFPGFVRAPNQLKFTGQEILLLGLNRYSVKGALEQTLKKNFDMDYSAMSRGFKIFNKHMLKNSAHLLTEK